MSSIGATEGAVNFIYRYRYHPSLAGQYNTLGHFKMIKRAARRPKKPYFSYNYRVSVYLTSLLHVLGTHRATILRKTTDKMKLFPTKNTALQCYISIIHVRKNIQLKYAFRGFCERYSRLKRRDSGTRLRSLALFCPAMKIRLAYFQDGNEW